MIQASINEIKIGDIIVIGDKKIKIIEINDNNFKVQIDRENINYTKQELLDYSMVEKRKVFTHNCQERLVCGQLGIVASRMALDDTLATTIDGTRKGAGIVKSQSVKTHIQYYFEKQNWIEQWFEKRGLTKKGYEPHEDPNVTIDPNTIDLGDDEEITMQQNKTVIEFQNIRKEINNSKDQKFEEI